MRLFLDHGSSLTFMSTAVRRLMPQLKPVSRANLRIQAFSSLHNVQADRFKLTLRSTHGNTLMEAFAYEHDFGVHPSSECPPHVLEAVREFRETHQLADRSLSGEPPFAAPIMLVGMDQFYKVAYLGREVSLIDGVIAKETRLGWVIETDLSVSNQNYRRLRPGRMLCRDAVPACRRCTTTMAARPDRHRASQCAKWSLGG